jgi:hypothetical protein
VPVPYAEGLEAHSFPDENVIEKKVAQRLHALACACMRLHALAVLGYLVAIPEAMVGVEVSTDERMWFREEALRRQLPLSKHLVLSVFGESGLR